jgi:predicted Zn-dependent peptidase
VTGVDRTQLPGVGTTAPFQTPAFRRATLDNGASVWTVSHRRAPVLTLRLLIPTGSATDPAGQWGLAALTADLLDEGTVERSDVELHEALTRLGAHLAIDASSDATVLSLTTLPKHAREALGLFVEVVTRPRFDADDCRRVRDLRSNRVLQMRQVPSAVADRVFIESLYATHPYGHLSIGTEESLRRLEVDDVRAFHQRWYRPDRWTLVTVGDLPDDELHALSEAALKEVSGPAVGGDVSDPDLPDPPRSDPEARLVFVPRPEAVQSEIRLGHAGVSRSSPDHHALLVLNMILGGQFVSRINLNLREDKGYTYGARTVFDWRVGRGPFLFRSSVQTGATADAISEVIREIDEIRTSRPVTEDELALARAALTRGFPRSFETASQVARAGTSLALHGLPLDEMSRFVARVAAVDVEAVSRAARSHLHPDRLLAVVVGSEADVLPSLQKLGLGQAALVD